MTENNGPNQIKSVAQDGAWYGVLRPFLRENGAEFFGGIMARKSPQAGEAAEILWKAGVNIAEPVKSFFQIAKKSRKDTQGLLEDFSPALTEEYGKSNSVKLMSSKNQIIANERARMMGRVKYEVYSASSGLVALSDDFFDHIARKRKSLDAAAKNGAAKATKPEKSEMWNLVNRNDKLDEKFGRLASSSMFDKQNLPILKMGVGGLGTPLLKGYFDSLGGKKHGGQSAHSLIKAVVKQAHSGSGHMDYVMHPKLKEQMPLKDYVLEIFKQHQEDMDQAPLNKRFHYMPEMEEACAIIADEIKDNLLDPKALVSLVGNRAVLDDHMRVAGPETVRAEIGKIRRAIEKTENIDPHKFIADTAFATKEEFKEIFDAVPEEHKPFFASLFPDSVLQQFGGLKEAEITELREQGEQEFVMQMSEAILTLGTLDEKTQQRYGLTAQEGKLMQNLAKDFKKKGEEEVMDGLKGQKRLDAVEAVRNARGYWQDLVAGRDARNSPAVAEAERATASAANPAGEAESMPEEGVDGHAGTRHAREGGFASREKPHAAQGERKYADAVTRKGEHEEQRIR